MNAVHAGPPFSYNFSAQNYPHDLNLSPWLQTFTINAYKTLSFEEFIDVF